MSLHTSRWTHPLLTHAWWAHPWWTHPWWTHPWTWSRRRRRDLPWRQNSGWRRGNGTRRQRHGAAPNAPRWWRRYCFPTTSFGSSISFCWTPITNWCCPSSCGNVFFINIGRTAAQKAGYRAVQRRWCVLRQVASEQLLHHRIIGGHGVLAGMIRGDDTTAQAAFSLARAASQNVQNSLQEYCR